MTDFWQEQEIQIIIRIGLALRLRLRLGNPGLIGMGFHNGYLSLCGRELNRYLKVAGREVFPYAEAGSW